MITFANRASAILFRFLKSRNFEKPFLLPANVCPVVPLSMMKAGVDYEFVDIDERHAMSEDLALEKLSSGSYSGLLFVHSYGHYFDNKNFYAQIKCINSEICIIDDRCLCKPSIEDEVPPNVDLALFSTGYAKYVELSYGGYGVMYGQEILGTGGGEFSEEDEGKLQLYIKDCLKNNKRYDLPADFPWMDCSPLKMEPDHYFNIIRAKISKIESEKERINRIYRQYLPEEIQWGKSYNDWRFMLSVEDRDQILRDIFNAGLFAGTNFPSVAKMFKGQHCDKAEKEETHILNLFNDFRVNEDMAYRTCELINAKI